jgi:DNA-binding MarR family transcriptional regulator
MSMETIYGKPGHLIRRAQQISTALFAEECGAHDLTAVQYAALAAIRDSPGLDATRLSALIAFDRSTLGDVLERLEAKGWIARTPGAADKRIKQLSLTAAGTALLGRVDPAVVRVQDRILAPLAPPDRGVLMRLLEQLVDLHHDRNQMSE